MVTNNTGGVLVFDLPNLPIQGGQGTRVFNNRIFENNTENFAPPGSTVGAVRPGTGLLILANDNIEVFENQFADNNNVNIMIYSYTLGGRSSEDPNYDPYPEQINIHDNRFNGGGSAPRHPYLVALHEETGQNIPNIVWDGLIKEGRSAKDIICVANNGEDSFVNLNAGDDSLSASFDTAPHQCHLPRLTAIEFQTSGQ